MRTSQKKCLRFDCLLSILNFEAHLKQFERMSILSKHLKIFRVKKELFVQRVSIGIIKKVKETLVDKFKKSKPFLIFIFTIVEVFYEINMIWTNPQERSDKYWKPQYINTSCEYVASKRI